MMNFWRCLFAFFFAPLCFGGSSSSKSSQEYNTTDNRVAGGAQGSNAVGASGSLSAGNGVSVSAGGSVTVNDSNAASFARLLDTLDRVSALQGHSLEAVLHSADGITELAAAQGSANTPGLDNKTIALLVVAGVVGLVVIARKG